MMAYVMTLFVMTSFAMTSYVMTSCVMMSYVMTSYLLRTDRQMHRQTDRFRFIIIKITDQKKDLLANCRVVWVVTVYGMFFPATTFFATGCLFTDFAIAVIFYYEIFLPDYLRNHTLRF